MNCSVCGEVCCCPSESGLVVPSDRFPDDNAHESLVTTYGSGEQSVEWRGEVSARLSKYRSRRKVAPPRYPSLRLPFQQPYYAGAADAGRPPDSPSFETASNHALAPNFHPGSDPEEASFSLAVASPEPLPKKPADMAAVPLPRSSAKILEFPRLFEPAPRTVNELAEPVVDRPRILEVPEVAPQAPALGGITIDAQDREETEKRPGIEIPLQPAPVWRRILAAAMDGVILVAAAGLFGSIFWKLAGVRPPRFQIIGLSVGVLSLLWGVYHYLLIVYSAATPGLRVAGLEIQRFDGESPHRRLRRWRVLASFISVVSLGMGYAWAFLDEDRLCWHDRITHTYLAPRTSESQ